MSTLIKFFIIVFFASSLSFLNLTAYAGPGNGNGGGHGQGQGHGQGHGYGQGHGHGYGYGHSMSHGNSKNVKAAQVANNKTPNMKNATRFSNTDRTTITNFYNQHPVSTSSLPPGIAMNLARGKPLPPGIAKRSLSPDLVSQLPARPGYEYLAVGKDVALVNSSTGIVADILSNVLK